MSRQLSYYVVLRRDPDGTHCTEFGDHDRSVARSELDEYNYNRQFVFPRRADRPTYHLVTLPDAAQSTIDAEVARRNKQEKSQS